MAERKGLGNAILVGGMNLRGFAETAAAPELKDLCLVGWFHTRTRGRSLFTPEDKSIQDLFFPEEWQVALVLRLTKDLPPTAGFFVREPDGDMRIESSYHEFIARPNAAMLLRPRCWAIRRS